MIRLKKAVSWLKNYWYLPIIAILAVIALFVTAGSNRSLFDIIANAMDSHKKEVDAIDRAHQEEIAKREKALELYHATVAQIEEKFEEDQKSLDEKKKREIKRIIEENHDSPEELAKRISETMGFDVILPEE
jgi:hypothetical protein